MKTKKLETLNDISAAEAARLFDSVATKSDCDIGISSIQFPDNMAARDFLEGLALYRNIIGAIVSQFESPDRFDEIPNGDAAAPPSAVPEVPAEPLERLTPKERTVFGHMIKGLGNKEIAWECKTSISTIKAQVTSIFRKFGVTRGRGELLALAVKSNLRKEEQ